MILDLYKIHHNIPKNEKDLLHSLYSDLQELNTIIEDNIDINKCLYLQYQDWHDEYSPERTDPCPDYYGTYSLMNNLGEIIGDHMTIDDLNNILFVLSEYTNHLYN